IENLALRKSAWQQHNFTGQEVNWGAAKAVDGLYTDRSAGGNQCTMSNTGQTTVTWRVDLGSVVSISHIDIYYRTDNVRSPGAYYDRFAGFSLYVSNTTSKDGGHLCFHEIQTVDGTPVENQTISCSVHGRYVIYYNERRPGVNYPSYYSLHAYNELCEVEVEGCSDPTSYGVNCDQPCPNRCQEKRCDVITGHCLGCIPGYQGLHCSQECDDQRYGPECFLSCGNCSDGVTCHHANGTCPRGCNEGVEGDKCQTQCQPGFYGKDCRAACSDNCFVTNRCNRFTGECDGGCKPGWQGARCDDKCQPGYYGKDCMAACSDNCNVTNRCNRFTGECDGGCTSGWQGKRCDDKCQPGFYGKDCRAVCSDNCYVTNRCNRFTGECDGGCKPGWQGEPCDDACLPGFYGKNCGQRCSENCNVTNHCNIFTGECNGGCKPGWKTPTCQQEELSSCATCTSSMDDNTAIIVSFVGSVFIVLIGSVINFLIWKRNQLENVKKG
ncbi:multiple epidermal growth factor-like domains protein 10, partial [Ostrea edulis]|uniref:multiple epidermal growth factor-like domains protein 10 n=1 Tax=Ostrea edulis TaxID=37623 RepID=UPI0024AFDF39